MHKTLWKYYIYLAFVRSLLDSMVLIFSNERGKKETGSTGVSFMLHLWLFQGLSPGKLKNLLYTE